MRGSGNRIVVPGTMAIRLRSRGGSTTIYASSKLNRVGRRAARYDSGLSAHKCNRPARKRPAPHRIAHEPIACSRSRCGHSNSSWDLFRLFSHEFPLPTCLPATTPPSQSCPVCSCLRHLLRYQRHGQQRQRYLHRQKRGAQTGSQLYLRLSESTRHSTEFPEFGHGLLGVELRLRPDVLDDPGIDLLHQVQLAATQPADHEQKPLQRRKLSYRPPSPRAEGVRTSRRAYLVEVVSKHPNGQCRQPRSPPHRRRMPRSPTGRQPRPPRSPRRILNRSDRSGAVLGFTRFSEPGLTPVTRPKHAGP